MDTNQMDKDTPQNNSTHNPKDTPPSPPIPPTDENTINNDKFGGGTPKHISIDNKNHWYNVWGVTDKIAFWELWVNVLIAFATIAVFWLSRESTKAATRATEIADNTYKLSVKLAEETDSMNRVRFKMDSMTSSSQIAAIKEQVMLLKNQFEIGNRPFLTIDVKSINLGNFEFVMSYSNLGKYPTRIIGFRANFFTATSVDKNILIAECKNEVAKTNFGEIGAVKYLDKDPVEVNIPFNKSISESNIEELFVGTKIVCFITETIYEDIITKAQYKLTYIISASDFTTEGFQSKVLLFDDIKVR